MKRSILLTMKFFLISTLALGDEITVNADVLEQLQAQNMVRFTGEVEVIIGEMTLSSDEGQAFYGDGGPSDLVRYIALGDRVYLKSHDQDVEADEAEYDFSSSTLKFEGAVILVTNGTKIASDQMMVYIDDGRTEFNSHPGGYVSFTTAPPEADLDEG